MKRLIAAVLVAIFLVGCAASAYKTARGNANLVKNGMTIDEATAILGMAPTHRTSDRVQWRRGNAQAYNATANGAIEYKVNQGRIVDVPEGGVFGKAAFLEFEAEREARRVAENAEKDRLAAAEQRAEADRKAKEAADLEELVTGLEEESRAAARSAVVCNDKETCNKVFALAQIYASEKVDQKIQVATDTIIETYNPTDFGKMGVKIIKTPRSGTIQVVTATPSCNSGTLGSVNSELICLKRRMTFYAGFRPFIEAKLAK